MTHLNQYTSITGLTPISHDANGNLLLQNNVTYSWDSENRLLSVTPNTPALGDKSLVHSYDGQQRRVTRTIREWTAGGWDEIETIHFIYDGWNVIEEYALGGGDPVLHRNFTWGQDLGGSTSLQAAGGVGGLIMVEEITGGSTTAFHYQYDGNGNVTEITDLSGNNAASYRYDAFGNTLVSTGSYALQSRYRFSTKPLDSEVADAPLYYYGYRYYDPMTGRWPSRDPIGEEGGVNLYGFAYNNPIWAIDDSGLSVLFYGENISVISGQLPTSPTADDSGFPTIILPQPFGYFDFPQLPFVQLAEDQPPPVDYDQPKDYNCAGLASRNYEDVQSANAAESLGDELGYAMDCNDSCEAPFFRYVVIRIMKRTRVTFPSGVVNEGPEEPDFHAYSGIGDQPHTYGVGSNISIINNESIGVGTQFPVGNRISVVITKITSKKCYCICCPNMK